MSATLPDDDATPETSGRPVVRLRPRSGPPRLRAPWAYADEIVLDRRTRAIPAGTVVELQDAERRPLGSAAFNAGSKIAARLLDADPGAAIDAGWFAARLGRALALRQALYDAPFYRLVHAEADGLPGVVIDRFGDAAAVQPNAAWAEARLPLLVEALQAVTGVTTVVKNAGGRARTLEGLADDSAVLAGRARRAGGGPDERRGLFRRSGAGAEDRDFLRPAAEPCLRGPAGARARHARRLRACRGLRACGAGRGCDLGAGGGRLGGGAGAGGAGARRRAGSGTGWRRGGATPSTRWRRSGRRGGGSGSWSATRPPSRPNKAALEAGLRAYERVARLGAALVAPDGFLVLCSCSHAADLARFREASLRGVARAGRAAQILHVGGAGPDHPVHPLLAETAYLKALFLRLGP